MAAKKRLTPALATLLFLLSGVACQVIAIKIFPAVVGAPLVEDNAYILTRIMEVYLNVAETGPGLYGMEAAAMHYYGVHAKDLDRKQACALAACLPAPLDRNPEKPTPALRKRQSQIYALIPTLRYPDWAL